MSKSKKILGLSIIACLIGFVDLFVGASELGLSDILALSDLQRTILFNIRLPEMTTSLIVGMILGLSGAIMQTILDNPLASPFTLGVSSAAGFGAALFLLLGFSITIIPFAALSFALISIAFVYFFSKKSFAQTSSMILAGIAVKFFFDSLTSLSQYLSTDETLSSIVFWLFGSVSNTKWDQIILLGLVLILAFILVFKDSHRLTALRFGEERAKALGVDVKTLKIKSFIIVSVLSALSVSFAGVIGFIGIIAPHLARKTFGEDQRYYLGGAAILGGILLTISSLLSKALRPGSILPIGIISSLLGLPLIFIFLLRRKYD